MKKNSFAKLILLLLAVTAVLTVIGCKEKTPSECNHEFENDVCIHCGEKDISSKGLEFRSYFDGTCALVGIGTCTDTDIVIPTKSPEGDVVISIEDYAFYSCTSLTSITIPERATLPNLHPQNNYCTL